MSADALRARSMRARAATSDRNDCCAPFCAARYCCRAAWTCVSRCSVLALGYHPLIEQRLDPVELGFGPVERRFRVHDLRDVDRIERLACGQAEPGFDLRGIGFGFTELRVRLGTGDPDEHGTGGDARAAFDWRRDHASCGFGGDLRLFVRHERAGDAEKPIDRLILEGDRPNGDRRRFRERGSARLRAGARSGDESGDREGPQEEKSRRTES